MIPELTFVSIPEGDFLMGSETGRDEEKPAHRVWVDGFELCVYQVRNRDYAAYLDATGRAAPPCWSDANLNQPDQPVVAVSWFDAVQFCSWLNASTGKKCRLPTEAEWERAARGGRADTDYSWGAAPPSEWPEYQRRWCGNVTGPLAVGGGSSNSYGVFDIGENVHEWCSDWYDAAYYQGAPRRNPAGPAVGERRASRGGSWRHQIKVSRTSARSSIPPEFHYADYGFRVAR
jgi:formylglycine-generating enzyme required for sulfatase activity